MYDLIETIVTVAFLVVSGWGIYSNVKKKIESSRKYIINLEKINSYLYKNTSKSFIFIIENSISNKKDSEIKL